MFDLSIGFPFPDDDLPSHNHLRGAGVIWHLFSLTRPGVNPTNRRSRTAASGSKFSHQADHMMLRFEVERANSGLTVGKPLSLLTESEPPKASSERLCLKPFFLKVPEGSGRFPGHRRRSAVEQKLKSGYCTVTPNLSSTLAILKETASDILEVATSDLGLDLRVEEQLQLAERGFQEKQHWAMSPEVRVLIKSQLDAAIQNSIRSLRAMEQEHDCLSCRKVRGRYPGCSRQTDIPWKEAFKCSWPNLPPTSQERLIKKRQADIKAQVAKEQQDLLDAGIAKAGELLNLLEMEHSEGKHRMKVLSEELFALAEACVGEAS
ncbi:hypothetical protein C8J56DRAFT_901533 [Mycena floridula]|nr:hypothetical protein C8J56DRAFT_901533 [Mycena floridula]